MRLLKMPLFGLVLFLALGFLPGTAAEVSASGDTLTLDYFLQKPDYNLTFWYSDNGSSREFVVNWKQLDWNRYKKTCHYPDGMQDYFYYLATDGTILETKSGWSIPESEWTDYPVIEGSKVVFRNAVSGATWSNEFVTEDAWGNLQKEHNSFTYRGIEDVEIQGELVPAAKLSWTSSSVPIYEAPDAEWRIASGSSRGEDWYVRGLGLVKRNFLNTVGYVTSGFTLTSIWDSRRNTSVPIEEWQPVSIIILGEVQGEKTAAAVYDGSILVPVRNIFDYFGQNFTWNQTTKILTVDTRKGPLTLTLETNYSENEKDGSILILPAPAKIINGRLMVPVEFVNEVLGVDSRWDKAQRTLEIFPIG